MPSDMFALGDANLWFDLGDLPRGTYGLQSVPAGTIVYGPGIVSKTTGERRRVLISFPRLQPLRDLMIIHQVVSRQPVRFYNEYDAQPSNDPGLVGAPAKFAQSKATVPVRLAEMPGYQRKLFLDLIYDLIAKLAG